MIQIKEKGKCSGCHACMAVCPKNAITMQPDSEGFLYPIVDIKKCINCGLCDKSCQAINPIVSKRSPIAYACNNLDEKIRMDSSSGGIFTALASWVISQNGVVFGAAFDDNLNVKHTEIDNIKDLSRLRGSKYVQSTIGDSFIRAKEYLDKDKIVLFTGTPCQIDGLLHYIKKDYPNLYTQDIICHGVPSPKAWHKYIEFQENQYNSKIKRNPEPCFRLKDEGWTQYKQSLTFENNSKYHKCFKDDIYMQAFLKNISLRPSCYQCNSKTLNRNSDITIADLWGCKDIAPDLFDDKGTSFVIVNSSKGKALFDSVSTQLLYQDIDLNKAVAYNTSMYQNVNLPKKRSWFFDNIDKLNFDILVKKAIKQSFVQRIKAFIVNYSQAAINKIKNIK